MDSFFLVLASVNGEQPARLGLALAKKCAVRAVDRNRIKRIVRESFRHHRLELNGIDYVVLCRRKAVMASNQALFGSLAQHWLHVRDGLCAG